MIKYEIGWLGGKILGLLVIFGIGYTASSAQTKAYLLNGTESFAARIASTLITSVFPSPFDNSTVVLQGYHDQCRTKR